jgi:hypothetical protein
MMIATPHLHDPRLQRDLSTLVRFIEVYCRDQHPQATDRRSVTVKTHDVARLAGHDVGLCGECARLLHHALVKRSACPMHPKPACKHCPNHCYAPKYRQQIREVMKYSGRALVMRGRLDYLWHLLF